LLNRIGRMLWLIVGIVTITVIAKPVELYAQATKPQIAVYVFGAEPQAINKAMTTRLISTLSNSGRYSAAENYMGLFEQVTNEQTNAINSEQIKKLGQQFNVEYICIVEITNVFGESQLSARIVDVKTGGTEAMSVTNNPLKSLTDIADASERIVSELFKEATPPVPVQQISPSVATSADTASTQTNVPSESPNAYTTGVFTDPRDGRTYKTTKIGNQLWMAENMNYQTSGGSWCYNNDSLNCDKYGKLYDWNTAKTVCPSEWHLPSQREWSILMNTVGINASKKLKNENGWRYYGNGTDDYGFSALPSGYYYTQDHFIGSGECGHWWTSTPFDDYHSFFMVMDDYWMGNGGYSDYSTNTSGMSVRCVQTKSTIDVTNNTTQDTTPQPKYSLGIRQDNKQTEAYLRLFGENVRGYFGLVYSYYSKDLYAYRLSGFIEWRAEKGIFSAYGGPGLALGYYRFGSSGGMGIFMGAQAGVELKWRALAVGANLRLGYAYDGARDKGTFDYAIGAGPSYVRRKPVDE